MKINRLHKVQKEVPDEVQEGVCKVWIASEQLEMRRRGARGRAAFKYLWKVECGFKTHVLTFFFLNLHYLTIEKCLWKVECGLGLGVFFFFDTSTLPILGL